MGGFAGNVDGGFTESAMVVDYVRVYQNAAILSSGEDVFANKFSVYPNPTSDRISVQTNENISKVEIYNTLGQTVFQEKNNFTNMNVSELRSGMYFMKIFSGERSTTKKIIVD